MPPPHNVQLLVNPSTDSYAVGTCPKCHTSTILDEDQYHGRVSMLCECGYHETHDLASLQENAKDT